MISTQALNVAPLLQDETVTVIAGVPVTGTPALLLANDSDPDGDPLGIVRYGQPSHGSLVINPDSSITYTANPGYSGSDSFTYVVSDGQGHESTATVYLSVQAAQGNQAPSVLDETVAVQAGVPVTGTPAMLLANDSDPDGDALSIARYGQPAHGSLVVNPDGSITYTANAGYNGDDSFTYVVSDGQGHETLGTVHFNVTAPANQAPVVQGEFLSLQAGVPVTGSPADLLANDSDPDGDTLRVLRYGTPSVGTLVQNSDGTITYTPPAHFNGQATLTYVVGDGRGGETTGTVTFDISGGATNTSPVAANDSATVVQDGSVRVAVLGNDLDADGDSLSVSQVGTPGHGVATLNPDGTITYVPALGFTGVDNFSYTISDGHGGSQSAQVTVTVQASAPDLLASSDTGSSNSDNITATTRPSFVVPSPPAGSVVVLLVDGVETAASFNASAKTLVPNLALSEGEHSVAYAFKPSAGGALTLTSAALGVTIDAVQEAPGLAPDLQAASDTGSSHSDKLTNLNRPVFVVGALPKTGDQANLYVDGVKIASVYDAVAGTLTPTLALSSATHTISWSITNVAGVESPRSTGQVVTVDTLAPATPAALDLQTTSDTGSSSSDNITANNLPSFTLAAVGTGDTVALLVDGVEVASTFVATTRTLTPVNALADGVHQVSVRLTDAAGNVSAAANALSVDIRTRAPEVSKAPDLQAGSDDGSSNSDDLTRVTLPVFAIPASPAGTTAALWVDGVKVAATYSAGTLKPTVALSEGNHWISYTLTDNATGAVSAPSPSLAVRIGGDAALLGTSGHDEFLVTTAEDETRLQVSLNGAQPSVQTTPSLHQVISTGAGNDLVDAGDGDDWLDLGEAGSALHGGTGQLATAADVQATLLMSEVDWRLNNSWGSWVPSALRNSSSDAGQITDWANVANAGWGQDVLKGGQGVDLLYGNEGDDWLMGAAGVDGLRGGVGDDTLRGGQGSDVLRGDDGRDTFLWMAGDAGTAGAPAQDRVLDFQVGPADEAGDVLDLRDLLVGELPGASGLLGNLASYLQIDASSSAGTLIHISSTGQFVPGGQVTGVEDQTVLLTQLDLRAALHLDAAAGNAQVIEAWLRSGGLQVGP